MKSSLKLLTLVLCIAFVQGCSMKPKEPTAEEIAAKEKAKADSIESANVEAINAKRVKLEQDNATKTEKRRLAAIEKAKKYQSYKDAKGKTVFIRADVMPVYNGGDSEMMKYLKANLQYPDNARDNGEEGTVFVDFIVDKTGKVTNVAATDAVNDDINPALRNESVRVVSSMPAWKPAKHKGKVVDAAYSIPIKFQLEQ